MPYRQSHPLAQFREVIFEMLNATTGAPTTGLTFSGSDIQIRQPGAGASSWVNGTQQGSVVELGGGMYCYIASTAEIGTPGTGWGFKVNKSGQDLFVKTETVERAFFTTAQAGALTTSQLVCDRTEASSFWNDVLLLAVSGALTGQVKKVGNATIGGGYSTGTFNLATGLLWSTAPSAGDVFEIIDR